MIGFLRRSESSFHPSVGQEGTQWLRLPVSLAQLPEPAEATATVCTRTRTCLATSDLTSLLRALAAGDVVITAFRFPPKLTSLSPRISPRQLSSCTLSSTLQKPTIFTTTDNFSLIHRGRNNVKTYTSHPQHTLSLVAIAFLHGRMFRLDLATQ